MEEANSLLELISPIVNELSDYSVKQEMLEEQLEEIMEELEASVISLENGKLALNEASEVYEKGMKLAEEANKRLYDTELKITEIKKAFEDKLEIDPEEQ